MLLVTVNVMQRLCDPPAVETCFDPFSVIVTLLAATNLDEVWSRFNIAHQGIHETLSEGKCHINIGFLLLPIMHVS